MAAEIIPLFPNERYIMKCGACNGQEWRVIVEGFKAELIKGLECVECGQTFVELNIPTGLGNESEAKSK